MSPCPRARPVIEDFGYARTRRTLSSTAKLLSALNLDGPLLVGLGFLALYGLAILYSASGQSLDTVLRTLVRIALGTAAMLALTHASPNLLRRLSPWIYVIGIALLLVVELTGVIGKGAQRWLNLGIVRFQPSEIMKLAVPMLAAWYLHDRPLPPDWRAMLMLAVIIFLPAGLVAMQPDLGTAALIAASGALLALMAGLSLRIVIVLVLLAVGGAFAGWHFLHDYQRERVLTFLNPQTDPLGAGYHIIQSQIALGSGGVFGKGWMHGSQAQLQFLPERSTDFIFAVVGEEFGLIGLILLLALYLFIVARALWLAMQTNDTYSRLLGLCIALTFFVYVFINAGMVSGLLPVVGVPLPLVSYGGTSVVTLLAGFGILMGLYSHRKLVGS
jgi:rod shape determining protein RodA